MSAKLLFFPRSAAPRAPDEPRPAVTDAELQSLLDALRYDARWCERFSASPALSNRDCGRLRKLARHLRREIAALTPKPGRS